MPYITKPDRNKLDSEIDAVLAKLAIANHEGEYNYVITRLIHGFVIDNGLSYKILNAAQGILDCAKDEFSRTVVAPYEDIKALENGPISDLDEPRVVLSVNVEDNK